MLHLKKVLMETRNFTDYRVILVLSVLTSSIIIYRQWMDLHLWGSHPEHNMTVTVTEQEHEYQEDIEIGEIASNCGIQTTCPDNTFPLHLSTGKNKDDQPRLCVSGKYILQRGVNGAGRGLNAAVIEPTRFNIVSVKNFDSYATNSTGLESWLQYNILDNDIVIMFTFDEASKELSAVAKNILFELGSSKVQDIHYRAQWYMITQKGTRGFTKYEKLTYSKNNKWGEMIEVRECIPSKIPKENTSLDIPTRENYLREQFCQGKTSSEWQEFCGSKYEPILPALLTNRSLIGNLVFSIPVVMYASQNVELFLTALDSLIHQPGVHLPGVYILYQREHSYIPKLAPIYGVHSVLTEFRQSLKGKIIQCIELIKERQPNQNFTMIIEPNVILSPDFFFFMAQMSPILKKDDSILAVSAWSPNCYYRDGNVHLAYRVNGFPRFGFMLPISDSQERLENETNEILVPDVSRVQGHVACHEPSTLPDSWIERPQDLTEDRYFHKLVMLLQLSIPLDLEQVLRTCSLDLLNGLKQKVFVVYYRHTDNVLDALLHCFKFQQPVYGRYKGLVRFYVQDNTVILLGDDSPFYKSRPLTSV